MNFPQYRSALSTSARRVLGVASATSLLAAGGLALADWNKAVGLTVDGRTQTVSAFAGTVGDVLDDQGITVTDRDVVVPAKGAAVADGDTITVRLARPLTLTLDGRTREYWTTQTTVEAALGEIGVRTEGAELSVSRSMPLGREGLALSITTPKQVTVAADGRTRAVSSTDATVADLLTGLGVDLGARDKVTPAPSTPVTEGLKVAVQRITTTRVTSTETIAHGTEKRTDAAKYKDERTVLTQGKDGVKTVVREQTRTDGKVTATTVVSEKVTTKPVTEVVVVGTKTRPATSGGTGSTLGTSTGAPTGGALDLRRADMWDRIARCESGGNWSINTGNGYYGGLQFSYSTWLGSGGGDFAPRADLATRAQQITIANRLYDRAGLQPWGCRHAA